MMKISGHCVIHGMFDGSLPHIATEVGIKSASIHYRFPRKADLGEAVAADYREKFMGTLKKS